MGIISSLIGAGAALFGAKKSADAAEDASDDAIQFQRDALATSIALQRPQLEVSNSALGVLAQLFGLQQPSQINFDDLSGRGGGFADDRRATAEDVRQTYLQILGREPDPGGLEYYVSEGFTPAQVAAAHRGSDEYAQLVAEGRLPASETGGAAPGQAAQPTAGGINLSQLIDENPFIQEIIRSGEQAIDRGAAARGLNQSGGTLLDIAGLNRSAASGGLQQFVLNPLFQLAGFGPQAAGSLGNAANSFAANAGNAVLGAGNARASSFQNAGNIAGNFIAGTDWGSVFGRNSGPDLSTFSGLVPNPPPRF